MQETLQKMMAKKGTVKRDVEVRFFGQTRTSRGFYIVMPEEGVWYLHHDGLVKEGVNADSEEPAFWPTEDAAKRFFNAWRSKMLLCSGSTAEDDMEWEEAYAADDERDRRRDEGR